MQGVARIGQVVHQQHLAGDFALGGGDETGDVEVALHRAGFGAVGAGGHDGKRLVENAAQDIAWTHATPRQAKDRIEFPARLVDLDG
ncbi:hypothetical protein D3C72_1051340 [compost metagenome]